MPMLVGIVVLGLLSGCATLDSADDTAANSASILYAKAQKAMARKDFQLAIEHYEKLEIRFPFGKLTQQAQLDVIYAYYRYDEADSAIAAANRFIKLYPRHQHVDYAYYLRALANFDRTSGSLDRWLKRDPATRDPRSARESFNDFSELVRRFPASPYAADAVQRMIHLRNYLARHEVHVAEYYLKLEAYVAAANRAKAIIEDYPRSPAAIQALDIMVQAYRALGLEQLANDAAQILQANQAIRPVPAMPDDPA